MTNNLLLGIFHSTTVKLQAWRLYCGALTSLKSGVSTGLVFYSSNSATIECDEKSE
jgi:hypothetical protein